MWPTNLDPDTPRGRALLGAATQVPDYQLDQQGSAEIVATNWLIFPDEIPDEQTGEISPVVWCVLFDKDGRFFKTTSVFSRAAFRAFACLYRPADWAAGIRFKITSRMTSNKHIAHDIRVPWGDDRPA
jgi:hypothetical protein